MSKTELIIFSLTPILDFLTCSYSPMVSLFLLFPQFLLDNNRLKYSECSSGFFSLFLITKLLLYFTLHAASWRCKYDHGIPCLKLSLCQNRGILCQYLHSGKGEKKIGDVSETIFSAANTVQRKQCAKSHQSVCSLMNDLLNKHFMGMHKYCLENS